LTVEEAGAENLWAGRPVPARPAVLRAELQMVGPRLWLEAGRLAGRAPAMVMDPPVIDGAGLAATTR